MLTGVCEGARAFLASTATEVDEEERKREHEGCAADDPSGDGACVVV